MNRIKKLSLLIMTGILLAFSACQEDIETLDRGDNTMNLRPQGPGDITNPPGGAQYPNIIKKYYPAETANYKGSTAWRIEWPAYGGIDPDKIPTFFATSTGTLNSLHFMNSTHPDNKKKLNFSLFTDDQLKSAAESTELWGGGASTAEAVYFRKIDKNLDQIKKWVTTRPSNFENYWVEGEDIESEIGYQEGDFFIFQIPGLTPMGYGGIRIVSESPRIIEVYHAIPN